MESPTKETGPIDPRITEQFLLRRNDVLGASAWLERDSIAARVTVTADARVSERDLRSACHEAIGLRHTPIVILLERVRRVAA